MEEGQPPMRLPVVATVAAAMLVAATGASAHTIDAGKPVVVFAGGADCSAVNKFKATLPKIELGAKLKSFKTEQVLTVSPASTSACDTALPPGPGGGFRNDGRRFADWLSAKYSEHGPGDKPAQPLAVDVVAEGESGVALRYALAKSGSPGWPTLDIEDAITVGAPHDLLKEPEYVHPNGVRGTDWTAIGTKDDAHSALAMEADHKTTYLNDGLTTQKLLSDGSLERDAKITYEHGDGDEKTWNKAPHGIERIALDLVHGPGACEDEEICASECRQKLAGWVLQYACPTPDQMKRGIEDFELRTPGGKRIEVPPLVPELTFPLPFAESGRLLVPVVLPDLRFKVGALEFSAVENLLDEEGLTIGSAVARLSIGGTETALYANDLRFTKNGVAAGGLGLDAFGWSFQATDVSIDGNGVSAKGGEVILPPALGGSSVHFSNLRIDKNGALQAELSGATIRVGPFTVDLKGFKLTETGFEATSAGLVLPKYLGNLRLTATNVKWDGEDLTFDQASGDVLIELAGGTFRAKAFFKYKKLDDEGAFLLNGEGLIKSPLFDMGATLELQSIRCEYAKACPNAVLLQEASVRITGKPVPLGTTGLAISGLTGKIKGSQDKQSMNADGTLNGVDYTVTLGARIQTYPNDAVFAGTIEGTLSTKGDIALKLKDALIFKYIRVTGGVCVLTSDDASVCGPEIIPKGNTITQAGAYIGGSVTAEISADSLFAYGRAGFAGKVFGAFVRRGQEWNTTVTVGGEMWAAGGVLLLGEFDANGSLYAQIGRFKTPDGVQLGVKGTLSGHITTKDADGKETKRTATRYVFIDETAKYSVSNTDDWTLAAAAQTRRGKPANAAARRFHFDLRPGQTQTMIVVEAREGSPSLEVITPQGRRAVIEGPGTIRPVGGTRAGQLANLSAVRTRAPHTVMAYVPASQPGRWTATVRGAAPGTYRVLVRGNDPVPRLAISAPSARKPARSSRHHRSVAVRGTLRGAASGATVTLYGGRGSCRNRASARLLATGVRVRDGGWRYRWTPKKVAPGRYSIHAELNNGTGPLVVACATRAVKVAPPAARRTRARSVDRVAVAAARPRAAAAAAKVKCGDKPFGKKNPKIPVLYVADHYIQKAPNGLTVKPLTDIAVNDFNAIKEDGQDSTLTYGRLDPANECEPVSEENRRNACKKFTVKDQKKPSCDEYPFASTRQGGEDATTMGVPDEQQHSQGGQMSAFLRKYRAELAQLNGKFRVCVKLEGRGEKGDGC
jgi:Deoxyribonuclease NucA/NucB